MPSYVQFILSQNKPVLALSVSNCDYDCWFERLKAALVPQESFDHAGLPSFTSYFWCSENASCSFPYGLIGALPCLVSAGSNIRGNVSG